MRRDIRLEHFYPHPPQKVWRAVADRKALSTWLMPNDFEPKRGHQFTFRGKPQPGWDGVTYCEVTELDPPRTIAFTWRGGPGPGKPLTLDTVVRFTLEPVSGGTRLVLEHTGFEGFRAVVVSFMMKVGWAKMMKKEIASVIDGLG